MRRALILTTAAALALGACSKQKDDGGDGNVTGLGNGAASTTVEDTTSQAVGAVTAPLANGVDAFVTNAAISDMYEIQAGKLAAAKAKSSEVKAFGQMMVRDHTQTSSQLKAALTKANVAVTPPTELDSRRQGMIENLKSASADQFDKVYLDQQKAAHQEALTLMKSYVDDGDNAALKGVAQQAIPIIQKHYDRVQELDRSAADGK